MNWKRVTIYLGKIHQFKLKLSDYDCARCTMYDLRGCEWMRVCFIFAHMCKDIRLMVVSHICKYIQPNYTHAHTLTHTAQSHQHSKQFNRKCNFKKISLDSIYLETIHKFNICTTEMITNSKYTHTPNTTQLGSAFDDDTANEKEKKIYYNIMQSTL